MAFVSIGVHFRQRRDPTAIAVAETQERKTDRWFENHFLIRHLERLPPARPTPRSPSASPG